MKKVMVFIATLLAAFNVFACFNSDPSSMLQNVPQVLNVGEGGRVDLFYPGWDGKDNWLAQLADELEPAAVINASFPLTLNIAFSGFVDDDGTLDADIKQLTIYYYDKNAGWQILKDIVNPRHTVVGDSARAVFGRHTITGPLGYRKGEYIPVVFYFRSNSGKESFDLNTFLSYRRSRGAPKMVEGAAVLAVRIAGNQVAH